MSLSKFNENVNNHQSLPDKPTLPANELKALWDKAVNDIKTYINTILTEEIDTKLEEILTSVGSLDTSKAPKNHLSSDSIYGVGNWQEFGHCKVYNGLDIEQHETGLALSAYQGRRLNDTKAPNNHAVNATTYGLGEAWKYGHCRVVDSLNKSTFANGEALSAHQGFELDKKINTVYNSVMNTFEELNQRVTILERKVK